ncbi:MAG: hypothetical protein ACPLXM_07180 [Bacteroidales bacterium]
MFVYYISGKNGGPAVLLFSMLCSFLLTEGQNFPLMAQSAPMVSEKTGRGLITVHGETNFSSFHLSACFSSFYLAYIPEKAAYRLVIPVTSFKARFNLIEQDFRQMVDANSYPEILIYIPATALVSTALVGIEIELAGKTVQKTIQPVITNLPDPDMKRIYGETSLNWPALGLKPPRRFDNLVEIHDTIFITFTLELGTQFNAAKY